MKLFKILLLINSLSVTAYGQRLDSIRIDNDTINFETSNAFFINQKNYETYNNSFITGSSYAVIRSQDNPRIFVDGIPMNPVLINNTPYKEFPGSMHLLSFDLQNVTTKTFVNDNRIISGYYNNSIDFKTCDINLGKTAPQFEVNNFTAMTYQDFDKIGYSTITNVNAQQSYKMFGYRFSLSNGFENDYIPENGVQRYSGNLKLKYKPIENISLLGFIDCSNLQDLKRTGENNLKSNRLFTYIKADITLTSWLSIYGKYGLNNVSDVSQRDIKFDGYHYWDGTPYSESYFEKNDYSYKTSYADVGFNINKSIEKNTLLNFNLGYNHYGNSYFNEYETDYEHSNGSYSKSWSNSEPETKEEVFYTSLKMSYKFLSIQYLFNRTNYSFGGLYFKDHEKKTFNNHVLSSNLNIIRNDFKIVNQLGVQFNYGKLANYTVNIQSMLINPSPGYNEPEWITKNANDNIEVILYSSFLKNRLDFDLSLYQKTYSSYNHPFQNVTWYGGIFSYIEDIGKLTKKGFELNGNLFIVQRKILDWSVVFSYAENSTELEFNDDSMLELGDRVINNKIISGVNNFRFKDFRLSVAFEGKTGYDINLYQDNISVAEPFTYQERTQITKIDNEGIPISEGIEHYNNYIMHTDYFILKQIGLDYLIRNKTRDINYVIGLQYNKMRRMYFYVNDIAKYQEQFQKPSFYSSLSVSFKMKF